MKDLHSHLFAAMGDIAAMSADPTPIAVDRAGYNSVELLLLVGIGGITFTTTHKVEFKLTHSDDDTTYTAVALADVLGVTAVGTGGIVKSLIAAHAAAAAYRIGYKGGKRYLKILPDFSGTHGAATPIAMVFLLGDPDQGPVIDQA